MTDANYNPLQRNPLDFRFRTYRERLIEIPKRYKFYKDHPYLPYPMLDQIGVLCFGAWETTKIRDETASVQQCYVDANARGDPLTQSEINLINDAKQRIRNMLIETTINALVVKGGAALLFATVGYAVGRLTSLIPF